MSNKNKMITMVGKTYSTKSGKKIKILADTANNPVAGQGFRYIGEVLDGGELQKFDWQGKSEKDESLDLITDTNEPKRFEGVVLLTMNINSAEEALSQVIRGPYSCTQDHPSELLRKYRVIFEEIGAFTSEP